MPASKLVSKAAEALLELGLKKQNVKPRNIPGILKKAGVTDVELSKSGFGDLGETLGLEFSAQSKEIAKEQLQKLAKEKGDLLRQVAAVSENDMGLTEEQRARALTDLRKKVHDLSRRTVELQKKSGSDFEPIVELTPKGQIKAADMATVVGERRDVSKNLRAENQQHRLARAKDGLQRNLEQMETLKADPDVDPRQIKVLETLIEKRLNDVKKITQQLKRSPDIFEARPVDTTERSYINYALPDVNAETFEHSQYPVV